MMLMPSPYVMPGLKLQKMDDDELVHRVKMIVSEITNIPIPLLSAKTRKREVVEARQFSMYAIAECSRMTLKSIGRHFGGRDHTTVIYAKETVEGLMQTYPKKKALAAQIFKALASEEIIKKQRYEQKRTTERTALTTQKN